MATEKNIFDYSHVKSVSAKVLTDRETGKIAGKIVANWGDSSNGSTCTAQVIIFEPERYGLKPKREKYNNPMLEGCEHDALCIGKAGGCGYDKFSAAVWYACRKGFLDFGVGLTPFDGRGESAVQSYFESIGLGYHSVI